MHAKTITSMCLLDVPRDLDDDDDDEDDGTSNGGRGGGGATHRDRRTRRPHQVTLGEQRRHPLRTSALPPRHADSRADIVPRDIPRCRSHRDRHHHGRRDGTPAPRPASVGCGVVLPLLRRTTTEGAPSGDAFLLREGRAREIPRSRRLPARSPEEAEARRVRRVAPEVPVRRRPRRSAGEEAAPGGEKIFCLFFSRAFPPPLSNRSPLFQIRSRKYVFHPPSSDV